MKMKNRDQNKMKNSKKIQIPVKIMALFIGMIFFQNSWAQQNSNHKKTVTVLNIDTKGLGYEPSQMGNLVRLELEKLDTFNVIDRYDVTYLLEKNQLNVNNCYGKICLVDIGKTIKSEKMLTGSVDLYGETIIMTIRLIDVPSEAIEKTEVIEFLNLPNEIQPMVGITLRKMFGRKNDENLLTKLTKRFDYENLTNNPNADRLRLDGARMGFGVFTGQSSKILKAKKDQGGYEGYPLMFQFGYQFETQYLNQGNLQALFEFIPMITGLDQGLFIPSLTVLHGLRSNINGWEFAFGPTFTIATEATGYYDGNNNWHLKSSLSIDSIGQLENPSTKFESRLDSRGSAKIQSGFVFAFGKTFKSGKLNIPVNMYVIPNKNGLRFGASFGFNAKNKK